MDLEKVSLLHNGKYLDRKEDSKTLKELGFIENDLILMQQSTKIMKKANIKDSDIDIMYKFDM